jgi:nicotinamidase/pyrazinamidase
METGAQALGQHDALIIVDVQNDFLPGGALAVPEGDDVIPPLNRAIEAFRKRGLPIFATRDWHPADHCSFRVRGGPWPPHCIANSRGAAFPPGLALPSDAHLISKATSADADAYSGFEHTDLAAQLHSLGCQRVFIGGLATDYCVRATALDALRAGLDTVVLADAVRAVELHPGDGAQALSEVRAQGAEIAIATELFQRAATTTPATSSQ